MLRFRVDPPTVRRVPHGLLDAAEVVEREDAHWRTGIEYDSFACSTAKLWGQMCTGVGEQSVLPDTVSITIDLLGSLVIQTYNVQATTATDGAFARQLEFVFEDGQQRIESHLVTGSSQNIGTSRAPFDGDLVITDTLTGVSFRVALAQDADGSLITPSDSIVFAVPQAARPSGCASITTAFAAAAATDPDTGVTVTVTSTAIPASAPLGERVVTVAGHRLVLAANAVSGSLNIPTGVGTGTWPISVRHTDSGSFVSGWMYIAMAEGAASLVQATCPVKEIRSAPWQTLFAPAWTIYAEVECQSMAFEDAAEAASDVLELAQYKAIESAWWDLAFDRSRVIGTGLAVTTAIAELEHYIATNYSGIGFIHVPVYMAAWMGRATEGAWITMGVEQSDGGELRTARGTPIVIGSGYPRVADAEGVGPAIMATGAVRLYMSEVTAIETFDRRTNLRSTVAERTVAAADDCLEPAVVYVDVGAAP